MNRLFVLGLVVKDGSVMLPFFLCLKDVDVHSAW